MARTWRRSRPGRALAALVLHINREVLPQGAEVALLRDLYLRQG